MNTSKLITRRYFQRYTLLASLVAILCLSVALVFSQTVAAAPQDNQAECVAASGEWKTESIPGGGSRAYCTVNSANPTWDGTDDFVSDSIYDNVSAHQHYWWLYSCFSLSNIGQLTASQVDGWQFFEDGTTSKRLSALGVMYPGEGAKNPVNNSGGDGYRDCSNSSMVKTAFGFFGYKNSREAFCEMSGSKYGDSKDGAVCRNGNGNEKWDMDGDSPSQAASFKSMAESKKPPLGKAEEYLRAYLSLRSERGCGLTFDSTTLYDSPDKVPSASSSNKKYAVPIVVKIPGSAKWIVKYVQGTTADATGATAKAYVASTPGPGLNTSATTMKTCNEMVNIARDNVFAYMTAMNNGADAILKTDLQGAGPTEDATSCAVDGIGWIICPMTKFLAGITDQIFNILEGMFAISPTFFDTSGAAYRIWSEVRNIANVAFVIAFMFIIYSQITGMGVSNYGIKKLLPRIFVAAILVNVSFWVCAIFVDLSNIAGSSVKSLLDGASGQVVAGDIFSAQNSLGVWDQLTGWILAGGIAGLTIGTVTLAALSTGGVMAALAALIPLMITVLFAVFTVVVILAARQALIIILIVIAPLAFVAYLLPNTEQWYKRWIKTLGVLLLVYPMIALVFGGSKLAAFVIQGTADNAVTFIFSLAIAAVPLFVTPLLLKLSGGLMNRFGGIVNNLEKGPFDRAKKWGGGVADRQAAKSKNAAMNDTGRRNPFRAYQRRNARRDAIHNAQESSLKNATTGYIAEEVQDPSSSLAGKMAAGGGPEAINKVLSQAINAKAQLEIEEVKAASAVIESLNLSGADRQKLAKTGSIDGPNGQTYSGDAMQRAAIQQQMKAGSMGDIHDLVAESGASLSKFSQTIADGVVQNGVAAKDPTLGGSTIDKIAQGKINGKSGLDAVVLEQTIGGKVTGSSLASMSDDARERIVSVVSASGDKKAIDQLKNAADALGKSAELTAQASGQRAKDAITAINRLP